MKRPVELPVMDEAQAASWHAMFELYEMVRDGWTLVGGQLVHLHCAERGAHPVRPTTDADAVVDIRADPRGLLVAARDLRESPLGRKDKQRLSKMVRLCRDNPVAMLVDEAEKHLARLVVAVDR